MRPSGHLQKAKTKNKNIDNNNKKEVDGEVKWNGN